MSNVNEFLQNWKTANKKKSYELYHRLLRSIQPKDLPRGKYYDKKPYSLKSNKSKLII